MTAIPPINKSQPCDCPGCKAQGDALTKGLAVHDAKAVVASSGTVVPASYKPALGREVKLARALRTSNAVAQMAPGGHAFMAPGLRPIASAKIMGTNFVMYANSLSIIAYSHVADPTGIASGARGVQAWANRFAGFQQYRVRSTTWEIIPIRQNVGTTTSSQAAAGFEVWIGDDPSVGTPTLFQMNDNNRTFVHLNTDKITRITYKTNEPQDLNLSAIGTPPSHVSGTSVVEGQHCLQCFGDQTYCALQDDVAGLQVAIVRPIYDVEFFGIGAN